MAQEKISSAIAQPWCGVHEQERVVYVLYTFTYIYNNGFCTISSVYSGQELKGVLRKQYLPE